MSEATRAKIAASLKGHPVSQETRAKISEHRSGKEMTPEWRARISTGLIGRPVSPETRMKIGVANSNPSPEARAKMSAARLGTHASPETLAKLSAIAKTRKTRLGQHPSAETRAKLVASHLGKHLSPEWREKLSKANWKGGRAVYVKKANASRRLLGFVALNASFPGCEGHHVDKEQVIYLPRELHHSVFHRQSDGRGMAKINAIAYNFLLKQEIEAAFAAKERV